MPPVTANNGFAPVIGHLNAMKELLNKMESTLKGTPYQPSSLPQQHVGNSAGNNPLNPNATLFNGSTRNKLMSNIKNIGANSLPASKPGINAIEKNRNNKLKNLTKNVKKTNINGSPKPTLNNGPGTPSAENKAKLEKFLNDNKPKNNKANNGLGNNPLGAINATATTGGRRSRKRRHTRRH